MTQDEWQKLLLSAKDLWRAGKPDEALRQLDGVVKRLETERSRDAADWEREQTLSLKASLLIEDDSRVHDAGEAYLELARTLRGQLRSYGRAIGFALAHAALCLFKEGKETEAFQAGEDALALLGEHGDTSGVFQELVGRMRQFHEDRARNRRPSPTRRW